METHPPTEPAAAWIAESLMLILFDMLSDKRRRWVK